MRRDRLIFDTGAEWDYNYLATDDGVSIVALTENREVYLLKEYRHPLEQIVIGLPSGGIEEFDSPLEAAKAELEEEAGVKAGSWTHIGNFFPSPGSMKHQGHIYLAQDISEGVRNIEDYEMIEAFTLPLDEAVDKIYAGEIQDAWAVIPILRVIHFLQQ